MMRELLLVRYGEVFLKGQNRPFFLRKLVDHVKLAVQGVGGHVWLSDGRIYVSDFTDLEPLRSHIYKPIDYVRHVHCRIVADGFIIVFISITP